MLTGGKSFCTEENCFVTVWRGVCSCWLLSSKPTFPCSALDTGLALCKLHFSFVSWFPVRFHQSGHRREPERQREETCFFLFASWFACAVVGIALYPGISSGFQLSAFGGTPSISLTAHPPQRSGFNSGAFFR